MSTFEASLPGKDLFKNINFSRATTSGSEPHVQKLHLILLIKFYSNKKIPTVPFFKYKRLKLELRVFLAGHSVAMITYCVTKIIPTCSTVIGHFFDTMTVASIDQEWL